MFRFFDIETTVYFLTEHVPGMLKDVIQGLFILAIAMSLSPGLTMFMLLLSPLFLLRSIYAQKKILPVFGRIWESSALLSRRIFESLSGMYIIKAMGFEQFQRRAFMRALIDNLRWKTKNLRLLQIDSLLSSFCPSLYMALLRFMADGLL